jgi:hypothetical protein
MLTGTYPTGITGSTYAHIARAKTPQTVLLLDAYKDVTSVLATDQVDIFKINREELGLLVQEINCNEKRTTASPNASGVSRAIHGIPSSSSLGVSAVSSALSER